MIEELREEFELLCENIQEVVGEQLGEFNEILEKYEGTTCIRDVDNFLFELNKDNLLTSELEDFIKNYLKYNNN